METGHWGAEAACGVARLARRLTWLRQGATRPGIRVAELQFFGVAAIADHAQAPRQFGICVAQAARATVPPARCCKQETTIVKSLGAPWWRLSCSFVALQAPRHTMVSQLARVETPLSTSTTWRWTWTWLSRSSRLPSSSAAGTDARRRSRPRCVAIYRWSTLRARRRG